MTATPLETGELAETGGIFAGILNLFAKIKADLKYNEEVRKEYRRKISVRSSEWIGLLGQVLEEITKKMQASVVLEYNGKRWHNAHPLAVKFFKEQWLISDAGE